MSWVSSSNPRASYSYSSEAQPLLYAPSTNAARLPGFNVIKLVKQVFVLKDRSQAYYWLPAWQEREREAEEDLRLGRFAVFDTMDDLIASLDEPLEDNT